jgi:hypothetical protein
MLLAIVRGTGNTVTKKYGSNTLLDTLFLFLRRPRYCRRGGTQNRLRLSVLCWMAARRHYLLP